MNKSLRYFQKLLILSTCICISCLGRAQNTKEIKVPVGFYNLENLFDIYDDSLINDEDFLPTGLYNYTETVYREKLRNLARVISDMAIDVNPDGPVLLGVSEVENRGVLKDLIAMEAIKGRHYQIVHFNSHDYRGIDVALLYNPKYFKLNYAKPLYLFINGLEYITRNVLWVNGNLLGEEINVFVNHWPSRRSGEAATAYLRDSCARISRHVMDSLLKGNPRTKSIVMGDLNDDPTDESVYTILNAKGDTKDVNSISDMFNPFYEFYKKGLGTTAYKDAWSLFDQVIISSTLLGTLDTSWHYDHAEVFSANYLKQKFGHFKDYPLRSFSNNQWLNGYSDHFPAIIYLHKIIK